MKQIPTCPQCLNWYRQLPDWERMRLTLKCTFCKKLRLAPKEDTPEHVLIEAAGSPALPGFEREEEGERPA